MKDLVEYIVKNFVTKPDSVNVEETKEGTDITLKLTVDPEDMGLVIGKQGNTIKALRRILTVRAIADNVRVNLQLFDPQEGKVDSSQSPVTD